MHKELRGPTRQDGPRTGERGGAALEYVLVTTFAALATLAALGFVGHVMKEQLTQLAEKLGVDADAGALDGLDDFGGGR